MCLKIENCYLKIFVEIRVDEKNALKCVKCCLKTQTKHPLRYCKFNYTTFTSCCNTYTNHMKNADIYLLCC